MGKFRGIVHSVVHKGTQNNNPMALHT